MRNSVGRKMMFVLAGIIGLFLVTGTPAYSLENCGAEAKIEANVDHKVYKRWTGSDIELLIRLGMAQAGTDTVVVSLNAEGYGAVFFLAKDCVINMEHADKEAVDKVIKKLEGAKLSV